MQAFITYSGTQLEFQKQKKKKIQTEEMKR